MKQLEIMIYGGSAEDRYDVVDEEFIKLTIQLVMEMDKKKFSYLYGKICNIYNENKKTSCITEEQLNGLSETVSDDVYWRNVNGIYIMLFVMYYLVEWMAVMALLRILAIE